MKNYVYWVGVKHSNDDVIGRYRYGDMSWMEYSKNTWQYWCDKNNVGFIHYDRPKQDDVFKYKVTWQRWVDLYDNVPDDYDSILTVDASIMVRWDAPNYFDVAPGMMCGMRANENWKWTHASANGYADMFPDVSFRHKDYFCAGMVMLRKEHEPIIRGFSDFYFENHAELLKRESETVKRGTDQPVLNYYIQQQGVPFHHWDINMAVNHLYRREILGNNWQIKDDPTPFFIKYFYAWQFSGFSDRGDTRTQLMSKTWDYIKHKYAQ